MSDISSQDETCQVDFYLLTDPAVEASKFACRLAMMAWERKQSIFIINADQPSCDRLNDIMWQYPEGRFLPHARVEDPEAARSPVCLGTLSDLKPADVVINLCTEAVPQPEMFGRVLEIVPFANDERQASRVKYKTYRNSGLNPRTHEIN